MHLGARPLYLRGGVMSRTKSSCRAPFLGRYCTRSRAMGIKRAVSWVLSPMTNGRNVCGNSAAECTDQSRIVKEQTHIKYWDRRKISHMRCTGGLHTQSSTVDHEDMRKTTHVNAHHLLPCMVSISSQRELLPAVQRWPATPQ